jgi:hypothetical protein
MRLKQGYASPQSCVLAQICSTVDAQNRFDCEGNGREMQFTTNRYRDLHNVSRSASCDRMRRAIGTTKNLRRADVPMLIGYSAG